jgi:polysaccharide biosynthesis/export protein
MPVFQHDNYLCPMRTKPRRAPAAALCAVLALALAGCQTRGGNVPYEPANFGAPDLETIQLPPGQQRIAPLDKLQINVFQVAELSGEFQVDATGNIDFPLIGTVEAQGRSPGELAQKITQALGSRYLQNPNVQVAISEATAQTITVDGSVRQPGVIPIKGATTLMRAVALAQGTSEDANPSRVYVFRTISGQRMAAAFDLRAIRRAEAEDPPIYGNDIVVVDGNRARSLFRDVIQTLPVLSLFRPF